MKNEDVLREVFSNHGLLTRYGDAATKLTRVESILADGVFWMNARSVMRLVTPVIKALGSLEKDGCCLSMVYHYLRELENHDVYSRETDDVASGVLTTIRGQIRSRFSTLKRESVLAAFLFDPSKTIEAFVDDDLDKAVDACVDLASRVGLPANVSSDAFRRAVLAFVRIKKSWKPEEREKNSTDTPLDWWMLKSTKFPVLQAFATRMLSIPTSSAASERSWSVHSFIHNKRRNRLKPARVEKLAFVYSNAGDKVATSQVHYKESEQEANDGELRAEFSESDHDSPVVSDRSCAGSRPSSTARSRLYQTGRRESSSTPEARRLLFTPGRGSPASNDHPPTLPVHNGLTQGDEIEIALTQSTGERIFTRADECQLVPSLTASRRAESAFTSPPTLQTSDRLVFSGGSSGHRRLPPRPIANRNDHSPRRLFGPFWDN